MTSQPTPANALGVVSFSRMEDGTREDYVTLARYEAALTHELPERLLEAVEALDHSLGGYKVTRKEHSLQSATRAEQAGRSDEYIAAALLHDTGDVLAPFTHGEMVASILRPYVAPDICWIVQYHGVFQMYYYGHFIGHDRDARDRYREHPHYAACAEFCEKYDQNCFDPHFRSLALEHFEPVVARVFAEPRYLDDDRW
jgi:predicted HD phosphohydrolase